MIPIELVYLLIAAGLAALVYRYLSGHGGVEILRPDFAGLPARGQLVVRQHEVRWSAADDDSFVAAWQLESGQIVAMQVAFDGADQDAPDLGRMELSIDRRRVASDVGWTEKIRDRGLRADTEMVLQALAAEAKRARSDAARVAAARVVGGGRGEDERGERGERGDRGPA
ncbi:MAG TPA: hypothetical protein VK987_08215 [Anaerolineae bacterium]|nr:hypothetical protein [Anaerolineae bacterium]